MCDDIKHRNGNSDNRVLLREVDRTKSFLEKSSKKPKRLSRLWKSLTHRKDASSQEQPSPQNSKSSDVSSKSEEPIVDLSENKEVFPDDDHLKNANIINTVTSYNDAENDDMNSTKPANGEEANLDACKLSGAAREDKVVPLPVEAEANIGTVHTQVDYVHYLVPDLLQIFNSSYYWGVMDRYEAEKLLETKPEGTFLLRDSAQEDFLFSVSFRRYNRSLHARIEQWDHKFSFDSHDSNVYSCKSVCGLIERYKDSSVLMFFEPMLTIPLPKTEPFSLQSLCRATLCSRLNYDHITRLPIPRPLMDFLQYYHYKQRVRVRRF